jgi:putative acetyltransferase
MPKRQHQDPANPRVAADAVPAAKPRHGRPTIERLVTRPAVAGDAQTLHEIHVAAVRGLCASSYSAEVIEGWLWGRSAAMYAEPIARGGMHIAESDGHAVGFCEGVPGEVVAVYVIPEAARQGVGRRLLAKALERASVGQASVRLTATLNAVGFYERFGFVQVGRTTVRRNDVDVPVVTMARN